MSLTVFNKLLNKVTNHQIKLDNLDELDAHTINEIEKILDVPKEYLISHTEVAPYIFSSKKPNSEYKKDQLSEMVYIFIIIILYLLRKDMLLQF